MSRLRRIVRELHRRSLWQILGIYLVTSWGGYQVVSELTDHVGLPSWVPAFAIVLFVVGLPVVLGTAFVQEGLPTFRPRDPTLLPGLQSESDTGWGEHPTQAPPAGAGKHHVLLTWPRAVLGGIVAFLLLGLTAGGYIGLRNAGVGPFGSLVASGALQSRDRVLIADFQGAGGDAALAAVLTEAFRVDFEQTPTVTVVEPAYVREVLARMERDSTDARLTPTLAREVARRGGIKAVLAGEVGRAAGTYVLTARLVNAADGAVLASYRETAADSTALIPALDRLSGDLREKIGDSLRSLRQGDPLEAVTTTSLQALERYSRGVRAMNRSDYDTAIPLLQSAVALDSTFAMAWRKLAAAYGNTGAPRRQRLDASARAVKYRDHLTERERLQATAFDAYVRGDYAAGVASYRTLLELYPGDFTALNNIAIAYGLLRQPALSQEYARRAVAADPLNPLALANLVDGEINLGRYPVADSILSVVERRSPGNVSVLIQRILLESAQGHFDAARGPAESLLAAGGAGLFAAPVHEFLSTITAAEGRLSEARSHAAAAARLYRERGNLGSALTVAVVAGPLADALIRGNPGSAGSALDSVLRALPLDSVPAPDRPYTLVAVAYGMAGRGDRARAVLDELDRSGPAGLQGDDRAGVLSARGWTALHAGRIADAVRDFQAADGASPCPICNLPDLERAYEAAGIPDSAIAVGERYLATPWVDRILTDATDLAPMHERLSRLYDAHGDHARAAEHAARFIALWEHADPEFQPRVAAMRRLLEKNRPDR